MADESIPQPGSRPARERHEWTDPEDEIMYTVTVADGWMSGMGAKPSRDLRIVQAPLVREILRLAEEVERLKADVKAHEEAGPAALRIGRVQGPQTSAPGSGGS